VAEALDRALFGGPPAKTLDSPSFARLKAAVNDKSWVNMQDHRMVNGWYVYGGRRTWDTETFPREYVKLRNMAAVRDRYVWDIAAGRPVPARPDATDLRKVGSPLVFCRSPPRGKPDCASRGSFPSVF
jgi:hypothetical protein